MFTTYHILADWIRDDITWCGSDCDNKDCFRHPSNRRTSGPYAMAYLKDTELCQLNKKAGEKTC